MMHFIFCLATYTRYIVVLTVTGYYQKDMPVQKVNDSSDLDAKVPFSSPAHVYNKPSQRPLNPHTDVLRFEATL